MALKLIGNIQHGEKYTNNQGEEEAVYRLIARWR